MTLTDLAAEIERVDDDFWAEDHEVAEFFRNHAPQIARALRLLDEADRLIEHGTYFGSSEWKDHYRALLEETGDA